MRLLRGFNFYFESSQICAKKTSPDDPGSLWNQPHSLLPIPRLSDKVSALGPICYVIHEPGRDQLHQATPWIQPAAVRAVLLLGKRCDLWKLGAVEVGGESIDANRFYKSVPVDGRACRERNNHHRRDRTTVGDRIGDQKQQTPGSRFAYHCPFGVRDPRVLAWIFVSADLFLLL